MWWSQREVLLKINVKILKQSSGTQQNKPFSWTLLSFIFLWEICLCKIYSSNSVFLKKLYDIKYTQCINIKCCGNMTNVAWMSVEMIERKSFPATLWLSIHHLVSCELKPQSFTSSASFQPWNVLCWGAGRTRKASTMTVLFYTGALCYDHHLFQPEIWEKVT